jgi:hypothetical protein
MRDLNVLSALKISLLICSRSDYKNRRVQSCHAALKFHDFVWDVDNNSNFFQTYITI